MEECDSNKHKMRIQLPLFQVVYKVDLNLLSPKLCWKTSPSLLKAELQLSSDCGTKVLYITPN